jgi:putative membrane protein
MTSLDTLPAFLVHFVTAAGMTAAFGAIYIRVTPHNELALIRAGNTGAAISLSGALIGFALPVGAAVAHSANIIDAAVWALVALVAQLLAFLGAERFLLPRWRDDLLQGALAGPVLVAGIAIAVGLLNAACLTG